MRQTLFVLTLLIAAVPAMASPREKTYGVSCDRLWDAVKATSVPPHYNDAALDDVHRKGVVSTGGGLSGKRYLQISLSGSGDACTLAVDGVFSGLAHDDKGDLLKRVDEVVLTPAPGSNSDTQTRIAVATESPSRSAATTAQTTPATAPSQVPWNPGPATPPANSTAQYADGPPAGSAATRIILTVTAHCAKDPDPIGLFSSDMYSSCKQDELNKLSGWITTQLANHHVLIADAAEAADYRLTVTLTKSMTKAGFTDFSAGTQVYEARYELADATGHLAQNGTVPFQCSGNDKNGEQKFATKIAETVAGLAIAPPTPARTPADLAAEANLYDILAQAYRALQVKPALPDEARLEKHKAEDALRANDPNAAGQAYLAALKSANWWPEGYRGLALALAETKNPGMAIVWMRRYLESVPDAQDATQMQAKIEEWSRLSPSQPVAPSRLPVPPGAHLGIAISDTPSIVAMALGQPDLEGALVTFVYAGSAAESAGLVKGDVVVSYNGTPVASAHDLMTAAATALAGTTATLEVVRGQSKIQIKVRS